MKISRVQGLMNLVKVQTLQKVLDQVQLGALIGPCECTRLKLVNYVVMKGFCAEYRVQSTEYYVQHFPLIYMYGVVNYA